MMDRMDVRVHMRHIRAAKIGGSGVLCAPGIRTWCRTYRVSLRRMAHGGVPLRELTHLQDAYSCRVRALALREAGFHVTDSEH